MNLIKNFSVEPFSRIIWKSREYKEIWEPVINQAGKFVSDLEIDSVLEDHRPCAWQTIDESRAVEFTEKMAGLGLQVMIIKRVAKFEGFAHFHKEPKTNEQANVCLVISKEFQKNKVFFEAVKKGDNLTQGRMLGYPECCSYFFDKVWRQSLYDPIWQIAENSEIINRGKKYISVAGHFLSNPLLRYIGIRAGFHIPCSFSCSQTISVNSKRMTLADKKNTYLSDKIKFLLSQPVTWSVLNGISQIETPFFYIIAQSVPVYEKYTVSVEFASDEEICRKTRI